MKCPGQDPRYWKFDAIFDANCPKCGALLEFFKDETRRRCKKCGHQVLNPKMDFGCAAHCKFAEHCFGDLPPELIKQKEDLFKDRVAVEMKMFFKQDFKRIGHSARVARYAEQMVKEEKGDPAVVLSAAYLHDVGAKAALEKYGNDAEQHLEDEGPQAAQQILEKLDAPEDMIKEVCDIIAHHRHPRTDDTANFKIVFDADLIADLEDRKKKNEMDAAELAGVVEKGFLTLSGRELARSVLLGQNGKAEVH